MDQHEQAARLAAFRKYVGWAAKYPGKHDEWKRKKFWEWVEEANEESNNWFAGGLDIPELVRSELRDSISRAENYRAVTDAELSDKWPGIYQRISETLCEDAYGTPTKAT